MKLTKFAYFLLFLSQVTVIYIFLNLTTHQGYTLFDFLIICVLFICFIIQTAYLSYQDHKFLETTISKNQTLLCDNGR